MTAQAEYDARNVRRIEAFSDIVIGFSLAQLGASLTIPSSGRALIAHPLWLFSFLAEFAIICSMWWYHNRLFARFFVPRALPILLNFIWLALVVLLTFFAQATFKLSDSVIFVMYFCAYAAAYATIGVQFLLGLRMLKGSLDVPDRLRGRRGAAFMFLWTVPFVICAIVIALPALERAAGEIIAGTFALFAVLSALLNRRLRLADRRAAPA